MKVLVGVAGRADVREVVSRAVDRAREAGDELAVAALDAPDADATVGEVERTVRETLDELEYAAEVHVLEEHAGSQLVELAEQGGFDRLVIEGGQRSPLGKIQLGETAEFVLLNAEVTVTLVR